MMRFAAHFVLALRALEAAPGASHELDFAKLEVIALIGHTRVGLGR